MAGQIQEYEISSGTGRTGASRSVCEAQVALIHLGGHGIGYVILIQSRSEWCFAVILGQECGREMIRLVNLVGTSVRNGKNV